MAKTVKLYEQNPSERELERVVKLLKNDGVIIYPTDGVYAFGCSLRSAKGVEKLRAISGKQEKLLSIVCSDISMVDKFARIDNQQFKILKRNTPGPFTFILEASSKVPDKALSGRRSVGVRIPDNNIPLALVAMLDFPLATTSVKDDDEVVEYTTDPELIAERYDSLVDVVIDGGYGSLVPTTLVDLTGDEPEILREGGGELK
ncbi:MAG: threonylcarbamoyl-AMP synthase [Tidjanibacter sp.]|nr:threonylcarbamoyl-AMP synthase [Tidjanibacter sp.]MBQ2248339.1 threonylcarbamoyl-AMP synthase [Tidjanibacter sp.]